MSKYLNICVNYYNMDDIILIINEKKSIDCRNQNIKLKKVI